MTWQQPPQIDALQARVSELILSGKRDLADAVMREACLHPVFGLWVLLRFGLGRQDAHNQWVFDRCCEVQASPDGHLDLWARGHYKSTIITFALTVQQILADPETTVGIFSHTRPIAKAFLRQIKSEFERNERLKRWFPDVLYAEPVKESPKWSEDEGIVVKRKGNPKEATVEAWGLVDGQPTSKHYRLMVYDDVVTLESVSSPLMIEKTLNALAMSFNLGAREARKRFIGTRYHLADAYDTLMKRGTVVPRLYPATKDGTEDGEPVFLSRQDLHEKRTDMGPWVFAAQMLLQPVPESAQSFREEWIRHATADTFGQNLVILVDPANSKKQDSDYTAAFVIGLGEDRNVYIHDICRDRLSLVERTAMIMRWHRRYHPMAVAYEQYGMMADIEHIRGEQERENYRFDITPVGGRMSKTDRIKRLIPWFEKGRIMLPPKIVRRNAEGVEHDLIAEFKDEYRSFPVGHHDDMLDALARFLEDDLPIRFPMTVAELDDDRELETVGGRNVITGY